MIESWGSPARPISQSLRGSEVLCYGTPGNVGQKARGGRGGGPGSVVREADPYSLSASTQETLLVGIGRTTHASLQFIILWGEAWLPRRQLSIVWAPDIKPHRDCSMKKHYHLALNLIRLREKKRGAMVGGKKERERQSGGERERDRVGERERTRALVSSEHLERGV